MLPSYEVFGKTISSYWTMYCAGAVLMGLINLKRRGDYGVKSLTAVLLTLFTALFGLVGAKLLYILESWPSILEDGFTLGGVSFFGTVFFLPLAILAVSRPASMRPAECLDYCTPAILLMLACLRIGCFLSGCCGGIALTVGSLHISSLPTQLIECALDLVIFEYLLSFEKKTMRSAMLYPLFMVSYGLIRFLIEFVRIHERALLSLTNGQWFSLLSIAIGAAFIINKKKSIKLFRKEDFM